MELIGQKVIHTKFGVGTIIKCFGMPQNGNKYIQVDFGDKKMDLPYPSSFGKYLKAVDEGFAKTVADALEELGKSDVGEPTIADVAPIASSKTQKHKPVSYCSINTFIFKSETGYNKSKRKYGFLAVDKLGRSVGVVFMHDDKRRVAYGQAEICFFDEYIEEFGEWRLISINKERLSFKKLSELLANQDYYEITIDPRRGS